MSAELGITHGNLAQQVLTTDRRMDHRFFSGMAVTCLVVVLIGFAPTYYLGPLFDARPLAPLVHVHAFLFTLWSLLVVVQTSLVAASRTDIHRRLGVFGGVLAALMLAVGTATAIVAAQHGVGPRGRPPLEFLAVPLGSILVFAIFIGAGLSQRRRSETHKRLMLLATISLLGAAFARMQFIATGGPRVTVGGTALLVLVCFGYDRVAHGRIHPAFLWGGLFLVFSLPARFALGGTEAWLAFARWLTG